MYGNKNIEDVLKYLYENKQEELAKAVLQLIKNNERTEVVRIAEGGCDTPHHHHNSTCCYNDPCYWSQL